MGAYGRIPFKYATDILYILTIVFISYSYDTYIYYCIWCKGTLKTLTESNVDIAKPPRKQKQRDIPDPGEFEQSRLLYKNYLRNISAAKPARNLYSTAEIEVSFVAI